MSLRACRLLLLAGWLGTLPAAAAPSTSGRDSAWAGRANRRAAAPPAVLLAVGLPLLIACSASESEDRPSGWGGGRRRAGSRAWRGNEKFRLHFRNNPIPIYAWRYDGEDFELVDFNVAADRITRGGIHRLVGVHAGEFYAPQPQIRADLMECYRTHAPIERELDYVLVTTGERKWFSAQYVYVPPDLVMVHTQDVTRQKEAEDSLRESETRYRHLFERLNDAALVIDAATGRVVDTNGAGETLFGRTRAEIVGRHHTELQPPEDAGHHRHRFESLARQGQAARLDSEILHADGTHVSVTVSLSFLVLDQRRLVLCLLHDNRTQRRTEELLHLQRSLAVTLSAVEDLGVALEHVVQAALQIEGVDAAAVYLHDTSTGAYELIRHAHLSPAFVARNTYIAGDSREAALIRGGKRVYWNRAQIAEQLPYLLDEGLAAVLVLPVHYGGGVVATLNAATRRQDEIPALAREALEGIAASIGGVIARVRTRAAFHESEEKFRTLTETAPAGILIVQRNQLRYVNPAMAAMLSYERAEMVGAPIDRFVHPEMRALIVERALARQAGGEVPARYEIHLMDRSRQSRWFDLSAARIVYEGEAATLCTLVDITNRRATEFALRESEERHRVLAQHATDFISRISPEGLWWDVSLACRRLLGFEPPELIGQSVYTLLHPDDVATARAFHDRILAAPYPQQQELRLRRKDGRYGWFEFNAQALRSPHVRDVIEIVAVSRDISERKAAEEASRRHREQLAHVARVSTMGEMASALAHELAQPLSAILYYARSSVTRLRSHGWGVAEASEAMQKIAAQAQRAGEYIHRMKRFVRKTEPKRVRISLHDIVREALGIVEAELRRQQVTIQCDLADDLPPVLVDPIQIEQVVLNLVRNSIDAVENLPPARRVVRLRTARGEGNRISLSIADQGCGFDASEVQTLFEYFHTTKDAGMGMGLPISRSIVEAHDGELWAQPGEHGGATFGFTLPAVEATEDVQV